MERLRKLGLQSWLQIAFIAFCLVLVMDGHHPPAAAQAMAQTDGERKIAEDVGQDRDIRQLQQDVQRNNDRIQKQWDAGATLRDSVNSLQGEMRTLFAALGLMQAGVFVTGKRDQKKRQGLGAS